MLKHLRSTRSGFTLLELLAVLVILGILSVILVPAIFDKIQGAKVQGAKVHMKSMEQSISAFNLDCGYYPSTEQGLEALISPPTVGRTCKNYDEDGYFKQKKLPDDPFGTPYQYIAPGQANPKSYDLFSAGPDGQVGTEDDIKAWE